MHEPKDPLGAFQWNRDGWFGVVLGGTCWLLIMAVLIAGEDPLTGGAIFLCYAISILYGLWLWRRRAELRPYPSIQKLIVVEKFWYRVAQPSVDRRQASATAPLSTTATRAAQSPPNHHL